MLSDKAPSFKKFHIFTIAICCTVVLLYTFDVLSTSNMRDFTTAIDIAGKQRMLINRMALLAQSILLQKTENKRIKTQKELTALLQNFQNNYLLLTGRIPKYSNAITKIFIQYYQSNNNKNYRELQSYLNLIKSINKKTTIRKNINLKVTPNKLNILSKKMTQLVDKPLKLIDNKILYLIKKQIFLDTTLIIVFFLMILFLIYFIFKPMNSIIRDHEKELLKRLQELFNRTDYAENNLGRYKAMIESAPTGIVILDMDRQLFVEANDEFCNLLEMNHEEALNGNPLTTSPEKQPNGQNSKELMLKHLDKTKELGSASFEWTHKTKNGTPIPCQVKLAMLPSKTGHFLQGHVIDLSEQKKLQNKLIEANEEKVRFLSVISHELRTPLNSILGYSELLRDNMMGDLTEKQKNCCNEIHQNGTLLLTQVSDLLEFTRLGSGGIQLLIEPTNISELLSECVSHIQSHQNANNLIFNLRVPNNAIIVKIDPQRFKQIIMNLLSNAIKFTSKGGTVTLTVVENANDLHIQVIDSGIGIPKEKLDDIFDPFKQIDNPYSHQFEGAGLGLSIVKNLVELHGGSISVNSSEGKGTTFTIQLTNCKV